MWWQRNGLGIRTDRQVEALTPRNMAMVDIVTLAAVALAIVGVVGALLPLVPGPLVSLVGVLLYWWHTGYTDPSVVILAGFVVVAVVAVGADILGGVLGASVGGGSRFAAIAGGVVGLLLIPVAGPFGILLGVAIVTFVFAYRATGEPLTGLKSAAGATLGMLASIVVQVLLTIGMLIAFLVVVFV